MECGGRRVGELGEGGAKAGSVRLERGDAAGIRGAGPPIRVFGTLDLVAEPAEGETPYVAVAVGGVIRRVVPALGDGRNPLRAMAGRPLEPALWISAVLPLDAVRAGGGLELYLLAGSRDAPTLRPLTLR